MPTVLLVRHGRTNANATGVLAGWTPGIALDETGLVQAKTLAERLADVPLAAAVASPLERCRQTAGVLLEAPGPPPVAARAGRARRVPRPAVQLDDRLGECRYGDWTGRALTDLAKEPLWRTVQVHPSAVRFPGEAGETMLAMQTRAVTAVREHDVAVAAEHGDDAIWLAVSHGDVIKALLADALGMHLDAFQRIVVEPCSVSVVRYTPMRPFVVRMNDSGTDLRALVPPPRKKRRRRPAGSGPASAAAESSSDAVVGGSAGAPSNPATA